MALNDKGIFLTSWVPRWRDSLSVFSELRSCGSKIYSSYSCRFKVILKMIGMMITMMTTTMMMMTTTMMMIVITRVIATKYVYIHIIDNIDLNNGTHVPNNEILNDLLKFPQDLPWQWLLHAFKCKEHLKAEDRLCLKRVKVRPWPRSVGFFGQPGAFWWTKCIYCLSRCVYNVYIYILDIFFIQ